MSAYKIVVVAINAVPMNKIVVDIMHENLGQLQIPSEPLLHQISDIYIYIYCPQKKLPKNK